MPDLSSPVFGDVGFLSDGHYLIHDHCPAFDKSVETVGVKRERLGGEILFRTCCYLLDGWLRIAAEVFVTRNRTRCDELPAEGL